MVLAGSSEHLASGYAQEDRPHLVGYMLRGYAIATYDYEYVPMARSDHYGYFAGDAALGVTGINATFALGTYNQGLFNTAAIRYFRYLAVNNHEKYPFLFDKIGVFGNSKGGFQTFLGSEDLQRSTTLAELGEGKNADDLEEYLDRRVTEIRHSAYFVVADPETPTVTDPNGTADNYLTFDGDTRYQNGKTETVGTVRGGTRQPWLTYTDAEGVLREIPSGVQFVYSSCGGITDNIGKNHAPLFTTVNFYDSYGSGYSTQNYFVNLARIYDIPSLWFTCPIAHSLVSGADINHGTDTYTALFTFSDYYLKSAPVSVIYTEPKTGDAEISPVSSFLIKFSGAVPEEEIRKVTVTAADGTAAEGEWSALYGKTEWSFTPTAALKGGTTYIVTVPATLKGDNGRETGGAYTFSLRTEAESTQNALLANPSAVTDTDGLSLTFTVPEDGDAFNCNKLRFRIANDAANTAEIYTASSPTDAAGNLLGSVMLRGAGVYEYDVTDYVRSFPAGTEIYFMIRAKKAAADTVVYRNDFESKSGIVNGTNVEPVANVEDGDGVSALKFFFSHITTGKYGYHSFRGPTLFSTAEAINGGAAVTGEDYGRRFTLTLRMYDTVSRPLQLWMNDCTNGKTYTGDYDYNRAIFRTTAGEWGEYSLDYTVYESDYGVTEQIKTFRCLSAATGSTMMPVFVDSLTVTEHVTDLVVSAVSLVSISEGTLPYPASTSDDAVFEVNGSQYSDFASAVAAVSADSTGTTIRLLKNHDLENGALQIPSSVTGLTLDLGGYRLRLRDSSLLSFTAADAKTVSITIKNGAVILGSRPLISHAHTDTRVSGKIYRIRLEELYLGTTRVYEGRRSGCATVMTSASSVTVPVTQELTLTKCTLSLDRNTLPKTPITVFPLGSEAFLSTTYRIAGGTVYLSSLTTLSLSETTKEPVWGADDTGTSSCLVLPESAALSENMTIMNDKGYAVFVASEHTDGEITYQPQGAKYSTKYGVIPDDKSPEEWPFAIFSDGELIGLCKSYCNKDGTVKDHAMQYAANVLSGAQNAGKEVQIVLRRDYDMTTEGNNTGFYNLGQMSGSLVIDLGEYTLTLKSGVPLLDATAKAGYDSVLKQNRIYGSEVSVIDGHIVANEAVVYICAVKSQTGYTICKNFSVTFNGTKITVPKTSRVNLIINNSQNNVNPNGALFDVRFVDCELDVSAAGTGKTLFCGIDKAPGTARNDLYVTVAGGNITAGTPQSTRLFDSDDYDRFVFAKDSEGTYTTLTLTTGAALPDFSAKNEAGASLIFEDGKEDGANTVYSLSEVFVTEYGIIPSKYDSDTYPFALFMDGKFLGAYSCWSQDNTDSALRGVWLQMNGNKGEGKTIQVLLRRNYTIGSGDNSYNNLAHLNGTVFCDFGDFTFTLASGKPLFNAVAQTAGPALVSESNFIVKGGTIVTNGASVVKASTNVPSARIEYYAKAKKFCFTFDGTVFKIPENNGNSIFQTMDKVANDNEHGADFHAILNSCTIDIRENSTVKTLFSGTDATNKRNRLHLRINGGSLLASAMDGVAIVSLDENDTFFFGEDANGNTLSLTLPTGKTAPADSYPSITASGYESYKKFTLSTSDGISSLYLLTEEFRIRGARLLIRDDVNVVYTAVIPDGYTSPYMVFEFLGKAYRVDGTDNGDGTRSFTFEHVLPQQTGDNIRATLYAEYLGNEVSVTKESYSVKEYCIYQIENSDDGKLVTLCSDLLIMGAEAQKVAGYRTDALVTDGLTLTSASTFVSPPESDNKLSLTGDATEILAWHGAGLRLENQMAIYLTFRCASTEGLKLRVTVADRTEEYEASDFLRQDDGYYRVYVFGIGAAEFDETVTATFYQGENAVGQTLCYSVNSYIYAKHASAESPVQGLLRAVYNYGKSVYAYAYQN